MHPRTRSGESPQRRILRTAARPDCLVWSGTTVVRSGRPVGAGGPGRRPVHRVGFRNLEGEACPRPQRHEDLEPGDSPPAPTPARVHPSRTGSCLRGRRGSICCWIESLRDEPYREDHLLHGHWNIKYGRHYRQGIKEVRKRKHAPGEVGNDREGAPEREPSRNEPRSVQHNVEHRRAETEDYRSNRADFLRIQQQGAHRAQTCRIRSADPIRLAERQQEEPAHRRGRGERVSSPPLKTAYPRARASFCLLRMGNIITGIMARLRPMASTASAPIMIGVPPAATPISRSWAFRTGPVRRRLSTPETVPTIYNTPTIIAVFLSVLILFFFP